MMAETFQFDLVTPERLLLSEPVRLVSAPGVEGSFGILAGHAPLLAELGIGVIRVERPNGQVELVATSGGFLQATRDRVVILADTAELASEIDIERARAAEEKARQLLEIPGELSAEEIRKMIERAQNRIRVAQMLQEQ
ncbi:MAG TPA: ATP synthase F1 subunit epsilon [Chthonomonas sp.]|jgi:F-type H+-transporting ATPase subunit epsilon|uniref:ATP synthase F1 subunit epsilon n=1 Tax=Chthonomonas sp. TaxID=2282153 RepID=UPI002B4B177D|nr:ATP synthase F1 subunit epsilon [Chthonomonas sp.]HLH80467.1 ATP synthase F1 subunit epsilon [Chthonomonas sp.]